MKKLFMLLLLAATLAGCGGFGVTGRANYPNAVTPEAKAQFDAADQLYRAKRFSDADAAFEKFIAESPYTQLTDESRFRRGEIAFMNKNYTAAIAFYRQSFSEISSPSVAPKAHFKAALALSNTNRHQESIDELKLINRRDASAVLKMRADSLGVRESKILGIQPGAAIIWHLYLLDDYAESQSVSASGINPDELISEGSALAEVKKWVGDRTVTVAQVEALPFSGMKGKRSGGYATYKLALALQGEGDTKAAERQLKSYISAYPKHEYYSAARLLLGETGGSIGSGAGIVVGVIVPLSGRYASYGQSVLHGIECATGVYEPCVGPSGMKLIVRDSESITTTVVNTVDELAAGNAVAIIGPLISANAMDVTKRAQELGIPIISLSQREGVAEVGDYVFRNSVSDSSEMTTLADYAVNKMRIKRFYIAYTAGSKKGGEYRALFTEAVRSQGGSIAGVQVLATPALSGPINELRGRGAVEFGIKRESGRAGATGTAEEADAPLPGSGYEAIFIPDSIAAASYIMQQVPSTTRTQILGISRWGDEGAGGRAGNWASGAIFVASFFKDASDQHVATFSSQFKEAYGSDPTLLDALGYDAMRLVISAVQDKGASRRESVKNALMNISAFPGVTGKITFNAEGNAERELWVLSIKNGAIESAK